MNAHAPRHQARIAQISASADDRPSSAAGCQPQAASSPAAASCQPPAASSAGASRLAAARRAPRCGHLKPNGLTCGSPALRDNVYCYFHDLVHNPPYQLEFPPLEDANSVQLAIMYVVQRLQAGSLDLKTANTILYALQTASLNLRGRPRVNFEPDPAALLATHGSPRARKKPAQPAVRSDNEPMSR